MLKEADEFAIVDCGHGDSRCIQPPVWEHPLSSRLSIIRARHENANMRLKTFAVLRNRLRLDISRHADCFYAVLNITKAVMVEEPLFSVSLH